MDFVIAVIGRIISPLFNIGLGRIPSVLILYKSVWKHFGFKNIRLTRVNDFKMYVICRDWAVSPTMLFAHRWEPEETKICQEHIKPGMTVIDAGAYIGYYSILASRLVGDKGKVYSFEPSPESRMVLKKNIRENNCKNIKVIGKAVADKEGHSPYYLIYANPSNSSSMQSNDKSRRIDVATTTLDITLNDKKVDIVKMDIEGGEVAALKGMTKIIKNNPQLKMVIEVYPDGIRRAGWTVTQYINYLHRYFHLYIVGKRYDEVGLADIEKAIKKNAVINLLCIRRKVSV